MNNTQPTKIEAYEFLHNLKSEIVSMKSELNIVKNTELKIKIAKRINLLIDGLKIINSILLSKLRTDALDTLIYTLMQEICQQKEVFKGNPIPLGEMQFTFERAFEHHSDYKRQELVEMFKSHELSNVMNNDEYTDEQRAERIKKLRTDDEWIEKIEEFAMSYKRLIKWELK